MCIAEQPCYDENGRSDFVQSHIWSSKQFMLSQWKWVYLYMGQHSSEMKVTCLPVAWSHAGQPSGSAFMCPLLASYHSYLGCCRWSHLAILMLSFSGPFLLQRMKEKCRIMKDMHDYSALIKSWLGSQPSKMAFSKMNTFKFRLILNNLKSSECRAKRGGSMCFLFVKCLWLL